MNKKDIGKLGEDFAAVYFGDLGYRVLERNYHSRYGEIDLICENERTLVFVEVKTRNSFGSPAEAVDAHKQSRLVKTALMYLSSHPGEKFTRFDVLELWQNDGRIYRFNHIEDAFSAEVW